MVSLKGLGRQGSPIASELVESPEDPVGLVDQLGMVVESCAHPSAAGRKRQRWFRSDGANEVESRMTAWWMAPSRAWTRTRSRTLSVSHAWFWSLAETSSEVCSRSYNRSRTERVPASLPLGDWPA